MKKTFTLFVFVLLAGSLLFPCQVRAQAPDKMSYQAVIRDASGNLVTEQIIGMKISILLGAADGTVVYTEAQTPETNKNGLVSIEIGGEAGFADIDWSDGPYFLKTETDPEGGTNYTISGINQLLTVPYALHAKTAETLSEPVVESDPVFKASSAADIESDDIDSWKEAFSWGDHSGLYAPANITFSLPVLSSVEILDLTPEPGQTVYNSDENRYQIFDGANWVSIPANCWPEPTPAQAGTDQTFYDNTTSISLSGNIPQPHHGEGQWTIVSGEGGSFDDDTRPDTEFTGQHCTSYTLRWTISTVCGSSSSDLNVIFNHTPTPAYAGADQHFKDGTTSVTLAANTPVRGTGQWTIVSGEGGSFDDDTRPDAEFTGELYQLYELQWTISTTCSQSTSRMKIILANDGPGDNITDIDWNTYSTVRIGFQLWMAENLKVSRYRNGNSIPTALTDSQWENTIYGAYALYPHGSIPGLNSNQEVLDAYGVLYNWYAVIDSRGLCPVGWRVPGHDDWTQLEQYVCIALGNTDCGTKFPYNVNTAGRRGTNEGNAMKSCRQVDSYLGGDCATSEHPRWGSDDTHYGTDEFGFSALPGGHRNNNGSFLYSGYRGYWWSSTDSSPTHAWYRHMSCSFGDVERHRFSKNYGFSVRCVRDAE